MTALPPPEDKYELTLMGLEMGTIYGVASCFSLGWWALPLYALLGSLIGYICDQRPAY